jgi:RibD domain-containing protein
LGGAILRPGHGRQDRGRKHDQAAGPAVRTTHHEDFFAVWPKRTGNPFTEVLNNLRKYVASTTLEEPLPWSNSTLLKGDAAAAVAALKEQPGNDLVVLGSGVLVQSLMRRNLVDEYVFSIHQSFRDPDADSSLTAVLTPPSGSSIPRRRPRAS